MFKIEHWKVNVQFWTLFSQNYPNVQIEHLDVQKKRYDGQSAHQYRSQKDFKIASFLKNLVTEILVFQQEKLVSGFWFCQKWIRHENLPVTSDF